MKLWKHTVLIFLIVAIRAGDQQPKQEKKYRLNMTSLNEKAGVSVLIFQKKIQDRKKDQIKNPIDNLQDLESQTFTALMRMLVEKILTYERLLSSSNGDQFHQELQQGDQFHQELQQKQERYLQVTRAQQYKLRQVSSKYRNMAQSSSLSLLKRLVALVREEIDRYVKQVTALMSSPADLQIVEPFQTQPYGTVLQMILSEANASPFFRLLIELQENGLQLVSLYFKFQSELQSPQQPIDHLDIIKKILIQLANLRNAFNNLIALILKRMKGFSLAEGRKIDEIILDISRIYVRIEKTLNKQLQKLGQPTTPTSEAQFNYLGFLRYQGKPQKLPQQLASPVPQSNLSQSDEAPLEDSSSSGHDSQDRSYYSQSSDDEDKGACSSSFKRSSLFFASAQAASKEGSALAAAVGMKYTKPSNIYCTLQNIWSQYYKQIVRYWFQTSKCTISFYTTFLSDEDDPTRKTNTYQRLLEEIRIELKLIQKLSQAFQRELFVSLDKPAIQLSLSQLQETGESLRIYLNQALEGKFVISQQHSLAFQARIAKEASRWSALEAAQFRRTARSKKMQFYLCEISQIRFGYQHLYKRYLWSLMYASSQTWRQKFTKLKLGAQNLISQADERRQDIKTCPLKAGQKLFLLEKVRKVRISLNCLLYKINLQLPSRPDSPLVPPAVTPPISRPDPPPVPPRTKKKVKKSWFNKFGRSPK